MGGGGGKRVSNTTRRVDQDDPESGKGLRNGSVRSSTVLCVRVFLRGLPFFGLRWNLDRSAVGEGGGTYGHTYLVPTSTTLNALPPPPVDAASYHGARTRQRCIFGATQGLRDRTAVIEARPAEEKRRARECRPRRSSSWPPKLPAGRCLACPTARVLGMLPERSCPRPPRPRPAATAAAESLSVVGQWKVGDGGGGGGGCGLVALHKYLDPPAWRIPPLAAYLPLAPLPTAPVFAVPPNEKCRAAAAAAARPGSVIKRPGSGDESFGRGEWTIAPPHDGRGHTATGHKSQEQTIGSGRALGAPSDTELRPRGPASPSSTADGDTPASLAITSCSSSRLGHGAWGCGGLRGCQASAARCCCRRRWLARRWASASSSCPGNSGISFFPPPPPARRWRGVPS